MLHASGKLWHWKRLGNVNGMLEFDKSKWSAQANDLEILVNARTPRDAILIAITHE
jgi:hypothetical protein